MNRSLLLFLSAAVALTACEKNGRQDITEPPPGGANVKFFNFSVGSPQVDFFAGNTKMTGIGATTGVAYGNAGSGGWYNDIAPGSYTLQARIVNSTDFIGATTANIQDGKSYSYYLSGTYDANAKATDSFVIEDVLPDWDFTHAQVRFVNAVANSGPTILYAKNTTTDVETAIGGAVDYKGAGTFVALPEGSYNLSVRAPGSSTNIITRNAVTFGVKRVYTITSRGTAGGTMALDNTANR